MPGIACNFIDGGHEAVCASPIRLMIGYEPTSPHAMHQPMVVISVRCSRPANGFRRSEALVT
jgi:hypothetical protein